MNPLGVHALVWTGEWTDPSRPGTPSSGRSAIGFDLIEIPILDPSTSTPR